MIKILTAPVGWGKTYYAMHVLKTVYDSKTRPIYTNINLKIPYDNYLMPFDYKDFHSFCKKEFEFFEAYTSKRSQDRALLDDDEDVNILGSDNYDAELKSSGILDKYGSALMIWDECQVNLQSYDQYIARFFYYHRHFEDMDIILITQSIDQLDRKIRKQIDQFVVGQSPSKRFLSSSFNYNVYNDFKMWAKHIVETPTLRADKKIFSMYDSGGYKKQKPVFLKKFFPILGIVFFLVLFYKYVFLGFAFNNHEPIDQNISIPATTDQDRVLLTPEQSALSDSVKQDQQNNEQYFIDQSNNPNGMLPPPPMVQNGQQIQPAGGFQSQEASLARYIIKFNCTQTYCYFSQNRLTIPLGSVKGFFEQFNGKILFSESITRDFSTMTALVPSELYYLIESHKISIGVDSYDKNSKQSLQSQNSFNGSSSTFAPSPFVPNKGV